ncbi:hypothetical protein DPMN_159326 [Dreissena polymorpha]|uniref:Uncharacterized protein n=1 Tax=Dreissena polymorpha TaxID=45954 RepID=A0A9D4EN59_DREPO|nr:hypothetical protein DPMN_159326 [Dreissena polymorpha]
MIEVPTVRTTGYGQNFFRFEAARVWNSLPPDVRRQDNYNKFRRLIRTCTAPKCKRSLCRL